MSPAAAGIFVHESLTPGTAITSGWIFRCELAGPRGVPVFSFCWFCQFGDNMVPSVVTPHQVTEKTVGTVLTLSPIPDTCQLLNSPLVKKKIALSSHFLSRQ